LSSYARFGLGIHRLRQGYPIFLYSRFLRRGPKRLCGRSTLLNFVRLQADGYHYFQPPLRDSLEHNPKPIYIGSAQPIRPFLIHTHPTALPRRHRPENFYQLFSKLLGHYTLYSSQSDCPRWTVKMKHTLIAITTGGEGRLNQKLTERSSGCRFSLIELSVASAVNGLIRTSLITRDRIP